jgi:hypothetical protein
MKGTSGIGKNDKERSEVPSGSLQTEETAKPLQSQFPGATDRDRETHRLKCHKVFYTTVGGVTKMSFLALIIGVYATMTRLPVTFLTGRLQNLPTTPRPEDVRASCQRLNLPRFNGKK